MVANVPHNDKGKQFFIQQLGLELSLEECKEHLSELFD